MKPEWIDTSMPDGDAPFDANSKVNRNFDKVKDKIHFLDFHNPKVTSELGDSETLVISQKRFTESVDDLVLKKGAGIGVQGTPGFGVGVLDEAPPGMVELPGTAIKGQDDYGNYQVESDGSIMVWIPAFYYRWGHPTSPRYQKYGLNALDIVDYKAYASPTEAAEEGFALHLAFLDGGEIQKGFFIDKYLCSRNAELNVPSSLQGFTPIVPGDSSSLPQIHHFNDGPNAPAEPFSADIRETCRIAKLRGDAFFPQTVAMNRAIVLLSHAQGQAAQSQDDCAWYDATGEFNYVRGCTTRYSSIEGDVTYERDGVIFGSNTGSGNPFNKTTHNGHNCGVADIDGGPGTFAACPIQVNGDPPTFRAIRTDLAAKDMWLFDGDRYDPEQPPGTWMVSDVANTVDLGTTISPDTPFTTEVGRYGQLFQVRVGATTGMTYSNTYGGKNWYLTGLGVPIYTDSNSGNYDAMFNESLTRIDVDPRVPHMGAVVGRPQTDSSINRENAWRLNVSNVRHVANKATFRLGRYL